MGIGPLDGHGSQSQGKPRVSQMTGVSRGSQPMNGHLIDGRWTENRETTRRHACKYLCEISITDAGESFGKREEGRLKTKKD